MRKQSNPRPICACGHEKRWHIGGKGACKYGVQKLTGGCTCPQFHRQRGAVDYPETKVAATSATLRKRAVVVTEEAPPTNVDELRALRGVLQDALKRLDAIIAPMPRKADSELLGMTTHVVEDVEEEFVHNATSEESILSKCEMAILKMINGLSLASVDSSFVAIYTGYSMRSGGFAQSLATLRLMNLIEGSNRHLISTSAGKTFGASSPPNRKALIDMWSRKVDKCSAAILRYLADRYPQRCSAQIIARETGYSSKSGGFAQALANLRSLEIIAGTNADLVIHNAFR